MRLTLILALTLAASGQIIYTDCGPRTILTEAQVKGQSYQIRFTLETPCVSHVPAVLGAADHYDAEITVSHVSTTKDGVRMLTQIGKPFGGTYTAGKCYEDKPETLLKNAKDSVKPKAKP